MSSVLFVIMSIVAAVLLLTASITATSGAVDSINSVFYNSDPNIRSAHQYLAVAAVLGWLGLIILLITFIVAAVTGGFATVTISSEMLLTVNPTVDDITAVDTAYKEIVKGRTAEFVVFVILITVTLSTFIMGILSAVGAANLGEASQQDSNSHSAYNSAIISAITGLLAGGALIFVSLAYSWMRSERDEAAGKILLFQDQTKERFAAAIAS